MISIKELYNKDITEKLNKKKVTLLGYVHEVRNIGSIIFLLVRDNTGIRQVTALKKDIKPEIFKEFSKIPKESVVKIDGIVNANKEAPNNVEVLLNNFEILSKAASVLPLEVTEKAPALQAQRLDFRSVDLRKPKNLAIFKIQSKLIEGMQEYLHNNNFIQVNTPCIMGAASEGGADVFKLDYFGKEAFLRQDPQLHRQLTIAAGFEKIFDLGPSWRAELSHTVKHLCEYRSCAVEMAFIDDETDTMKIEQELVVNAIKKVIQDCKEELELLDIKLSIPKTPFPELRFPKIYEILGKKPDKVKHHDLDAKDEKKLYEYVKEKYKTDFYFINRFPSMLKPFYVMKVDETPEYARSVDLYFKGLELSSGGQREHRYDKLMENIKERNLNLKNLEWFTKFFRFGVAPHGGFAIGIERLTKNLLNLENIRDTTLFVRDPDRLLP